MHSGLDGVHQGEGKEGNGLMGVPSALTLPEAVRDAGGHKGRKVCECHLCENHLCEKQSHDHQPGSQREALRHGMCRACKDYE